MGKNLIQQRRGRGTLTYTANSHNYVAEVKHRHFDELERTKQISGKVIDLVHCPGHTAPLEKVKYDNGEIKFLFAPETIKVNTIVYSGFTSPATLGSTLPIKRIPEGTLIHNIENTPGDGGKYCRTAGSSAKISSVTADKVLVQMPSRKLVSLHPDCRATIGIIAGAGKLEKPLVKAGKAHHIHRATGRLYPRTSGVAMNAVDHPFGSGRGRQHAKKKVASRHAPPGRKVGAVAARRTGRRR